MVSYFVSGKAASVAPLLGLALPLISGVGRRRMKKIVREASGVLKPTKYTIRLRNKVIFAYATEFHKTALKTGSNLVRLFLIAHAIELYLKTYLLHKGMSFEKLKKDYVHNLSKLLKESQKLGLAKYIKVSSQTEEGLGELSHLHVTSRLRYFSALQFLVPSQLPDTRRVFKFASQFKFLEKLL